MPKSASSNHGSRQGPIVEDSDRGSLPDQRRADRRIPQASGAAHGNDPQGPRASGPEGEGTDPSRSGRAGSRRSPATAWRSSI